MTIGKQNQNGHLGELLAEAMLMRTGFWVLKRTPDEDGADYLLQTAPESLDELRRRHSRIEAFAIVQAKYFEEHNEVQISKHYVLDGTVARSDFFALLNTCGHDGFVSYFFTAQQIVDEFRERDDFYVFSLTNQRTFDNRRNITPEGVGETIAQLLENVEMERNRRFVDSILNVVSVPTAHYMANPNFKYHLRIVDDVRVVICQQISGGGRRLLEGRRDLYHHLGDYCWGYDGSGPEYLATSVLAHHFNGHPPKPVQVRLLVSNLLANLDQYSEHVFTTNELQQAISPELEFNSLIHDSEDRFIKIVGKSVTGGESVLIVSLNRELLSIVCACGTRFDVPCDFSDRNRQTIRDILTRQAEATLTSRSESHLWAFAVVTRDANRMATGIDSFFDVVSFD